MRRHVVVAAAVVVLVAGGGVAYAQSQGSGGSYRTARVTVGDVDETMALSGTVTASARRDLSFGADGTVTKVGVAAGDTVRSGATLATLDPTDLETAVTKARAAVAKARAQLETDQSSQASTVTDASTASTSSASGTSSGGGSGSGSSSGGGSDSSPDGQSGTSPALTKALARLKAQQGDVTTAQTAAGEAITAATSALAAQATACEGAEEVVTEEGDDPGGESDGSTTTSTASLSQECTTALDAVQAAQNVVADQQDALQDALETLSTTLTTAMAALSTSGGSDSGSSGSGSGSSDAGSGSAPSAGGSSGSSSSSGSSGSGSAGGTVTAATLAQDQAAIDTARAELTEAKRALDSAELTAPYAGEILSVSVAKGDSVGSTDVAVVIKGNGSTTVTTTVTLDQVPDVEKGQTAEVTPAGADEPVAGTVTSIGLLPDTSSDTSTYPVTIDLDDEVAAPEGATASISLVTGTAEDVVTVPSSAVSTTGRTTVQVLKDGAVTPTAVTVGVVGSTRTSITDGLAEGQEVVLADLDAALPSSDGSTTTRSITGGGGGFGGGQGEPPGRGGGN